MTKDEALRLAWDALEDIGDEWGFTSKRTVPKRKEAITAIKEALAQTEQCRHRIADARNKVVKDGYICVDCGALFSSADHNEAQPEQDLVEWGVDWGPDGNSVSIIKRLADGGIEVVGWEYAPHPPQRTWVGLTNEEVKKIVGLDRYTDLLKEVVQIVEAKLKEKNA
jgi:hypothetical protein